MPRNLPRRLNCARLPHRSSRGSRMRTLSNLLTIFALLAVGADPARLERTVKLVAATVEGTTQYIIVTPAEGGPSVRLVLTGDAKRKYVSLLNGRGELFNVTIKPGGGDGNDLCTAVAPFDGPKGLKSPRAWLFDGRGEQKL